MTSGARNDSDPSALLRQATALKDAGDPLSAVACLRAAYEEIARGSVDYGTQTFLRLPLYLQAAGRNDEAWREFNNLLTMGYPNQPSRHQFWETHLALVYDKMRLFLQREGRLRAAVIYGVLSYISDLRGRLTLGTTSPVQLQYFEQFATEAATTGVLEPLLRKAGLLQCMPEVFALVREWIAALPTSPDGELENRLNALLPERPNPSFHRTCAKSRAGR